MTSGSTLIGFSVFKGPFPVDFLASRGGFPLYALVTLVPLYPSEDMSICAFKERDPEKYHTCGLVAQTVENIVGQGTRKIIMDGR